MPRSHLLTPQSWILKTQKKIETLTEIPWIMASQPIISPPVELIYIF
jgi:hypothetical protein